MPCNETCIEAGIDYMEVGYKNSPRLFSKRRVRPLEALRRVGTSTACSPATMPRRTGLKLCAMADAGKSDYREQIVHRDESVLDMIRVAF